MSASAAKTLVPLDVAGAGRAAVVLAGVEVAAARSPASADRVADALLLDVHVERVEEQRRRCRAPMRSQSSSALLGRVDEVGLEPVERLDRQADAPLGRRTPRPSCRLSTANVRCCSRSSSAQQPRLAGRRVHRPDDVWRADRRGKVDARVEVLDTEPATISGPRERHRDRGRTHRRRRSSRRPRRPPVARRRRVTRAGSSMQISRVSKPRLATCWARCSLSSPKGDSQMNVLAPNRMAMPPPAGRDSTSFMRGSPAPCIDRKMPPARQPSWRRRGRRLAEAARS